jgi:class 3 adenylate cyclase
LFADVLGFSRLSAKEGPEKAYLAVTQLLRLLDAIARKHGGSVDKYQGDKLMAVFGYPVPLEHPPRAAVSAALEMRQQVADYTAKTSSSSFRNPRGINTGQRDIRSPVVREFTCSATPSAHAARLAEEQGPARSGSASPATRRRDEFSGSA